MFLIDDIVTSPVRGIFWIFEEINRVVQKELAGEAESVTEQLRLLYMQLETSQITEQQFDAAEKILLDRLDAIERRIKNGEEIEESQDTEDVVVTEHEIGHP
jgi:hypothetical protein